MKTLKFILLLNLMCAGLLAQKKFSTTEPVLGTRGTLSVSVTTADPGGIWGAENVLAAWVEDSSGKLVNTMMYFTTNSWQSAEALTMWWQKIGGQWSYDSSILDTYTLRTMDGITGATQVDGISTPTRQGVLSYGYRFCYWGEYADLSLYPDGIYTVVLEIANEAAPIGMPGHRLASYQFLKGPSPFVLYPPDELPSFQYVTIHWSPKTTALPYQNQAESYDVYPNPCYVYLQVNGANIRSVEIWTLTGKNVYRTLNKNINVSFLPPGTYLVKLITPKGTIAKIITKK